MIKPRHAALLFFSALMFILPVGAESAGADEYPGFAVSSVAAGQPGVTAQKRGKRRRRRHPHPRKPA